jgi:copper(I)-binding protein
VNVRRSIAVAAVVLAAPSLSACGINFNAQTDQPYNVAVGVDERSGSVDVLNALVVSGSNGSGTAVATLVNNDTENDDTLRDVSGAGPDADVTVKVAGKTTIPADGLLNLAEDGRISVRGEQIVPGTFVTITFSFDRAEAVTVEAPVVSSSNPDYADVPVPTGS